MELRWAGGGWGAQAGREERTAQSELPWGFQEARQPLSPQGSPAALSLAEPAGYIELPCLEKMCHYTLGSRCLGQGLSHRRHTDAQIDTGTQASALRLRLTEVSDRTANTTRLTAQPVTASGELSALHSPRVQPRNS